LIEGAHAQAPILHSDQDDVEGVQDDVQGAYEGLIIGACELWKAAIRVATGLSH
jgi:hypothetical protein